MTGIRADVVAHPRGRVEADWRWEQILNLGGDRIEVGRRDLVVHELILILYFVECLGRCWVENHVFKYDAMERVGSAGWVYVIRNGVDVVGVGENRSAEIASAVRHGKNNLDSVPNNQNLTELLPIDEEKYLIVTIINL